MTEAVRTATPEMESYQVLLDLAGRRTGAIAPDLLVRHVLSATRGGDWPVQRAAMEAVLRRCGFGKRDGLQVTARPPDGQVFGLFRTARQGSSRRPYRTLLAGIEPLKGSCNCPDFLRNSLGICKHILTAVNDVVSRPKVHRKALELEAAETAPGKPVLAWDPLRPLSGDGDWLERIHLEGAGAGQARNGALRLESKLFAQREDGRKLLRQTHLTDTRRRLALVENLAQLVTARGSSRRPALSAEPAVSALLLAERESLRHLCAISLGADEIRDAIRSMKQKPYPYQREGIQRFFDTGRLLLADDMGLGKTAQAIAVCHVLWKTKQYGALFSSFPQASSPSGSGSGKRSPTSRSTWSTVLRPNATPSIERSGKAFCSRITSSCCVTSER